MAQELHPQLEELGGRVYDTMLEGKLPLCPGEIKLSVRSS